MPSPTHPFTTTENRAMNEATQPATALAVPQPPRRDLSGITLSTASVFDANDSFELGWRMAGALSSGSNLPEAYCQFNLKGGKWEENPAAKGNCLIAIELANRLRTSPLLVIQNLYLVKGKPSFSGAFIIALINSARGPDGQLLFKRLQFEWCGDPTKMAAGWKVRAWTIENATGERLVGAWITFDMVKGEGWLSNGKWTNMPEQMGMYRAATFWGRSFAADILYGLNETSELEDIQGEFTRVPTGGERAADLNRRLEQADREERQATEADERHAAAAAAAYGTSKAFSEGGGDTVLKDKPIRRPRRTKAQMEAAEAAKSDHANTGTEGDGSPGDADSEDEQSAAAAHTDAPADGGQPDHEHHAPQQDPAQPASGGNLFSIE